MDSEVSAVRVGYTHVERTETGFIIFNRWAPGVFVSSDEAPAVARALTEWPGILGESE